MKGDWRSLLLCLLMAAPASAQWAELRPAAGTAHALPTRLFPADHYFNQKLTNAPVDPASATILAGWDNTHMNYDFGDIASQYGFPWVTVSADYPCVYFTQVVYASESDTSVCYPIPVEAHTQPGWTEKVGQTLDDSTWTGDRHMLIVDPERQYLYEIYQPYHNHTASPVSKGGLTVGPDEYYAASVAFWDMKSNANRPQNWTSSDAAGLPVIPGLIQYDEVQVSGTPIQHAYRTTMNFTFSKNHVYPASHHAASCSTCPITLGMRVRLKSSVDISGYGVHCQRVLQALKDYGFIYADNGGQMYGSGFNDDRWGDINSPIRSEFLACMQGGPKLTASFDVVQIEWGADLLHEATPGDTYVRYRFGAKGLPLAQSCDVTLQDSGGNTITTNTLSTGPSKRETSFTGLSPSTSYKIVTNCGATIPEAGVAFAADSFTTTASTASGNRTIPITVKPSALLSTAARVTVDYGTTSSVADGSVQNTSCSNAGGGCTVNLSLPKGVEYWRLRWQDASNNVLATSLAQALTVK